MNKYNGIDWEWRLADNGWVDYICPRCGHANNMDIQCYPSHCEKCGWSYKDDEEPRSIEDVDTNFVHDF